MASSSNNPLSAAERITHAAMHPLQKLFSPLHEAIAPLGGAPSRTLEPELNELAGLFHGVLEAWRGKPERQSGMRPALNENRNYFKGIHEEYCFCLGSLWKLFKATQGKPKTDPKVAEDWFHLLVRLLQLAQLVDRASILNPGLRSLKKPRHLKLYAQDPDFVQEDIDFLRFLHIEASADPKAYQKQVTQRAILYAPRGVYAILDGLGGAPAVMFTDLGGLSDEQLERSIHPGERAWYKKQRESIEAAYQLVGIPAWLQLEKTPMKAPDVHQALQYERFWVLKSVVEKQAKKK